MDVHCKWTYYIIEYYMIVLNIIYVNYISNTRLDKISINNSLNILL